MLFAILNLGLASVIVQFILIRELQVSFQGNELSLAVILLFWLAGVSCGSLIIHNLLKNKAPARITFCFLILAEIILYFASLFLTRSLKPFLGISSFEVIQPLHLLLITVITVLPLSLLHGAAFVYATRVIRRHPIKVYIIEALGAFLGGSLCLILPLFLNSIQIIMLLSALSLTVIFYLSSRGRSKLKVLSGVAAALFFVFILLQTNFSKKFQDFTNNLRFKPQQFLACVDSIYGNIAVTKLGTTYSLYENGKLYFSTEDTEGLETLAAMCMISHPKPGKILLLGSGISGLITQILKYPVDKIDYVELDPALISSGIRYIPDTKDYSLKDKKVTTYNLDARAYIKGANINYDLILLNLGDPSSLQLNRFYTQEFFKQIKGRLKPGGAFCLSVSSKEDILSAAMLEYNASIYKTLKTVFTTINVIPGEKLILSASDSTSLNFNEQTLLARFNQINPSLRYFTRFHIGQKFARTEYITKALKEKSKDVFINYDYLPKGLYYYLGVFGKLSLISFNKLWGLAEKIKLEYLLILSFILIFSFRKNIIGAIIFTSGFAGLTLELLISLIFQINFGYLYYQVGFIIGLFMLALALGSMFALFYLKSSRNSRQEKILLLTESGLAVTSLLIPFILKNIPWTYYASTMLCGLLIGFEFSVFCRLKSIGLVYGLDVAGSGAGSAICGLLLIPCLGIYKSAFFIAAIKFIGLLFLKKHLR